MQSSSKTSRAFSDSFSTAKIILLHSCSLHLRKATHNNANLFLPLLRWELSRSYSGKCKSPTSSSSRRGRSRRSEKDSNINFHRFSSSGRVSEGGSFPPFSSGHKRLKRELKLFVQTRFSTPLQSLRQVNNIILGFRPRTEPKADQ